MNTVTRIEGEVAMSAPAFFWATGRQDLVFWRRRRTNSGNMGEPIRTRKSKFAGRVKHNARRDWVVECNSKEEADTIRPFELSGKERSSLTMMKRNKKRTITFKRKAKMNQVACRAYNTGHGESDTKMAIQSHIRMAMSEDNALCCFHKISL